MNTREHLIQCLADLCREHGGYKAVADKAGVDDQSLYQIISGVKLPSGNPKGVGPTIQRKLDAAYPGWADAKTSAPLTSREELAPYNAYWPFRTLKPAALQSVSEAQLGALERVLEAALSGMATSTQWREIAHTLAGSLDRELGKSVFVDFVRKVDELARQHETTESRRPTLTS